MRSSGSCYEHLDLKACKLSGLGYDAHFSELFYYKMLVFIHIFLFSLSNLLVQYHFDLWGLHTTYGAFSYPLIFIVSDLTTRLYGTRIARHIVYQAMLPGLFISFLISLMAHRSISSLWLVTRISVACFVAYSLGQLIDIYLFSRVRSAFKWYWAPIIAGTISNAIDTYVFFFIAFFHSSQHFFALYWLDIANVDLIVKCFISIIAFVPFYGLLIKFHGNYLKVNA